MMEHTLSPDTQPEAETVLIQLLRQAPPFWPFHTRTPSPVPGMPVGHAILIR
ncbi:MAG: hypothetical protein GY832_35730 [Chloroflexi bacterium]|nr:hypothetical protein [Chloroflexota bacterium]